MSVPLVLPALWVEGVCAAHQVHGGRGGDVAAVGLVQTGEDQQVVLAIALHNWNDKY